MTRKASASSMAPTITASSIWSPASRILALRRPNRGSRACTSRATLRDEIRRLLDGEAHRRNHDFIISVPEIRGTSPFSKIVKRPHRLAVPVVGADGARERLVRDLRPGELFERADEDAQDPAGEFDGGRRSRADNSTKPSNT